ncbi:lipocalin-15 [Bombina bombina]|uniref:lipocalin-15 n=1 Tax=Bombina bombina TaxID=8345 RepID=UPI00235AB71E|nr:lipocalin-15 [Bombina bombina]
MKAIYETITPGHYKFSARGENEVIIIGTDYDHFGLEYTRRVSEKEVTVTVKLFGRQTDLPEAVLNKFKEMCKALGLKDDLIVILPKGVECDPTKV